jgi:methionine aminopeptidase
MRVAGRAVAAVLEEAKKIVFEGATALDIEMMAEKVIKEHRCKPAFKGYGGYPYITTVSVNEEVIHGFPLKSKVFKKGDIVSVDVGAIYEGNYGKPGTGLVLKAGMTLAIEPMVTEGGWHVVVLEDGWTVVTVDGKRAAHFEHTVVITENGCEVLTTL